MMDEVPTHGMSTWERMLLTAIGTIIFFILSATITQVIINSSRLTALETRMVGHDAEMDRIYGEIREHRKISEGRR
jgi:hypothetical protein